MTLNEAINKRRSRRKYLTTAIDVVNAEKLRKLAREYNQAANIRIELIFSDGSAFKGLTKSYGMLSGVQNYAGLIANKGDYEAIERLGYYGELLMLHAVSMELGTCWVGGTFDRKLCPFKLSGDETIICTITIGNVRNDDSVKEKFIRGMTHRKTKSAEEMMISDTPVPDWFMNGMRSVVNAPSAINRQPVVFSYKDGKVTAGVEDMSNNYAVLDLGIAKLHFELGAGGGSWSFGNNGEFISKSGRL